MQNWVVNMTTTLDGSPVNPAQFDHFVIDSVRSVQIELVLGESEPLGIVQALQEQAARKVQNSLRNMWAMGYSTLMADGDVRDRIFNGLWDHLGKIADQIVSKALAPYVDRLAIDTTHPDRPTAKIAILVDVPQGYRRFAYQLHDAAEWEKDVTEIPTVTLDTSVIFDYWKQGNTATIVEALLLLASKRRLSLRVSRRIREDVPRPPLAAKIDDLPKLGVSLMGSVIRPHDWSVGIDAIGSVEFGEAHNRLFRQGNKRKRPDQRDWDHLHAHFVNRRDFFLTRDRGIIDLCAHLKAELGIVAMEPDEFLSKMVMDPGDVADL